MRAEINLLGPLQATVGGVPIVPTAAKPRRILAMLALNAGRVVTVAQMMEELWGTTPPRSAPATLHTYIVQLRRCLETVLAGRSKNVLVTAGNGYVMHVEPDGVDVVRYERRSALGRRAVNDGAFAVASAELSAGLSLWRGPVLVDLEAGPQLEIDVMGLQERRLSDLDLRIDADLRLGRHQLLLDELTVLCARHPMHENFHAQYMLALYRAGRQWQAQETYQTLRDSMVRQLGVDPAPRLRVLHKAILSGEPLLDDPRFVASQWTPAAMAG